MPNVNEPNCFIGLTGAIGSGKDTVADYLVTQHKFQKIAFADGLKQVCSALFGVSIDAFYDRFAKEKRIDYWGMSPREMAQQVGTEIIRNHFSPDHWIRLVRRKIISQWNPVKPDRYVFTDVRFQNEVDYVQKYEAGWIIKLDRPINPLVKLAKNQTHSSETQDLEWVADKTWFLQNDSTKEKLYERVREFIQHAYPHLIQSN